MTTIQAASDRGLEAQVYAELEAAEVFIPTVRPGVGVQNALIAACRADLSRGGENLTALWALVSE